MTTLSQILASCRYDFPDPSRADPEGQGLIAMGADLAPETLISAYASGLFPWFNEDEPIAWWCPHPRCVITPSDYKPSKSLKKTGKRSPWSITLNQAFDEVIHACSLPRSYSADTWIHEEMIEAYLRLHDLGFAHSIEVWQDDSKEQLIGGLYGLKIGSIYFGESMFHQVTDASKMAFWALMRLCEASAVPLVDCQLPNPHLFSLGATLIERQAFLAALPTLTQQLSTSWHADNMLPLSAQALTQGDTWQIN